MHADVHSRSEQFYFIVFSLHARRIFISCQLPTAYNGMDDSVKGNGEIRLTTWFAPHVWFHRQCNQQRNHKWICAWVYALFWCIEKKGETICGNKYVDFCDFNWCWLIIHFHSRQPTWAGIFRYFLLIIASILMPASKLPGNASNRRQVHYNYSHQLHSMATNVNRKRISHFVFRFRRVEQ